MDKKVHIEISDLITCIQAVGRIIPGAVFTIRKTGTEIACLKPGNTLRGYFTTTAMKLDEDAVEDEIELCLPDVYKFSKILNIVYQTGGLKTITVNINDSGNQIHYKKRGSSFKITGSIKETISRYIAPPIRNKLESINQVKTMSSNLQKIATMGSISDNSAALKVYISKCPESGVINAIVEDGVSALSDSIGMPICSELNDISGTWNDSYCIDMETFNLFNVFRNSDPTIELVGLGSKRMLRVTCKAKSTNKESDEEYSTEMLVIAALNKNK